MSKNNGDGKGKPEDAVDIDPSDIVETVGYLLAKEYNRHISVLNQLKDINTRSIVQKEIDYMKHLFKRLHIEGEIVEKDIKKENHIVKGGG